MGVVNGLLLDTQGGQRNGDTRSVKATSGAIAELLVSMYTGSATWHAAAGPNAVFHGASGEAGVVAIDASDGRYVTIPVDINPVAMPCLTMEVCVKLKSISNQYGWVMGHDSGDWGRALILHDTRF